MVGVGVFLAATWWLKRTMRSPGFLVAHEDYPPVEEHALAGPSVRVSILLLREILPALLDLFKPIQIFRNITPDTRNGSVSVGSATVRS